MAESKVYGKVSEDDGTPEGDRRIRQADFKRLEAQVNNLLGRIDILQARVFAPQDRMTKGQFAANFFGNAAAWDGSKVKNFRDWCEAGWAAYNAFMDGAPRPGLEERYGAPQVEKSVAPKPAPIGNGLAIEGPVTPPTAVAAMAGA